jgi:hypothetical protein
MKDLKEYNYLFDYDVIDLLEFYNLLFKYEKEDLLKKFKSKNAAIYGELGFSTTLYNISDIIVYKYFNENISFAKKALLRCKKYKEMPFAVKIKELEPNNIGNGRLKKTSII